MKIIKIGILFSTIFLLTQELSAQSANWIWGTPQSQAQSTCYFRKTLTFNDEVKNAGFYFAADDIAILYVNGKQVRQIAMKTTAINLESFLQRGNNVLALEVKNGKNPAGLIVRGTITTADRKSTVVVSDSSWKATTSPPANGWNTVAFDDHAWTAAAVLGPVTMAPWDKIIEPFFFLSDTDALAQSRFIPPDPARKGLHMVEDFADISSWMGGPVKGQQPGAVSPFQFSLGSMPCPERNDGYCGALEFDFIQPGGIVRFEKNALFKTPVMPDALEFDANAQGNSGYLWVEFADKREKPLFAADKIKISGNGWQHYRLQLNAKTIRDYSKIMFPITIRNLFWESEKAGKGKILIDDIAYCADLSVPEKRLQIHPEYTRLSWRPGEPVTLDFRIRNGMPQPAQLKVALNIYDSNNQKVFTAERQLTVNGADAAKLTFNVGTYQRKDAYRLEVKATDATGTSTFNGWLGVFEPNNRRLNQSPMWFGVEDQELCNVKNETMLHVQWMKQLGVDLIRGGLTGRHIESARGSQIGYESYHKMWQPHMDAGLIILMDYAAGIPSWVFPDEQKKRVPNCQAGVPDRPELLQEHIGRIAKFIAANPQIKYFEWFNEPDLNSFFSVSGPGTAADYINSLKTIYPILKTAAPELKITTGGMVFGHPAGKKDFNRQIYVDGAPYYDIAAYHGHDSFPTYKTNTELLSQWVKPFNKKLANTEAGYRSYHAGPDMFFTQAQVLVQKITYSKHIDAEFYSWFMLQDYWDKYINADDSFGLVTVDNQPKPSFVAYNELIRQLANMRPAKTKELEPRLESYCFTNGKEDVYVCWPRLDGNRFTFGLKTDAPITVTDIFGNSEQIKPTRSMIYLTNHKLPFYLRGAAGQLQALSPLLSVTGNNIRLPTEKTPLLAEIANPYNEAVSYTLTADGAPLKGEIAAHAKTTVKLPPPTATETSGLQNLPSRITLQSKSGEKLFSGNAALPYWVALTAAPVGAKPEHIILNQVGQVTELAFDQNTPRWNGPDDLSADITVNWDKQGLHLVALVKDSDHCTPGTGAMIWRNDCLQIAFADDRGRTTEITFSGNADGKSCTVWRHIAIAKNLIGKCDFPATVTRADGITTYRLTVPFEQIGITPAPGKTFRMSLLVNDNDQNKRLRIMEWNKGIENSKSPELFGWVKLK